MRALCVTVADPFRPLEHRRVRVIGRRRRIRALAPKTKQPFIAILNGRPVLRAEWSRKLTDGDTLAFVTLPQGGGGSNPLRLLLLITVAYFAPYLAGEMYAAMGGTFVAASAGTTIGIMSVGIGIAGSILVNALLPPPKPPAAASTSIPSASPTYSLQAQGNSARIGQPIPEVFGRHLVYPDFAAMPYTEYSGNDQYLYQLLVIGRGHYDIEALRIEDTPLANFDEVETEIIQPGGTVTLFPARVIISVEVSGQEAETDVALGPYVANPPGSPANLLGFDLVAPRGLYYANDDGGLDSRSISFCIEAQRIDDDGAALGAWAVLDNVTIKAATTTPIRRSYRYPVDAGRWQCRVTRTSTKSDSARTGNDLVWGALRAYLPGAQQYGDVTLLAMRIRATDNISAQASRKINAIVTRRLPLWTGSAWSAPTATRNPAWAAAYIARQRMPDARINLAALQALAATAAARGDHFDGVFDSQQTVWEALTAVLRSVRAQPFLQGGHLQVYRDQPEPLPVAMFSPRNMRRGSFKLSYKMASEDMSDAIDVEYFDSGVWRWKTVRAQLPGSTAAKPAKVQFVGITGRAQAWREGMYMAACNRWRRRFVSFSTEMEGFIPALGDAIAIAHDMPRWGQFAEAVAWEPETQTLTVSEPLQWASGDHAIAFRNRQGAPEGPFRAEPTGDPYRVRLSDWSAVSDPDPDTGSQRERSLVTFGPANAQHVIARVLAIRPRGMNSVDIEAVVESDYVHDADTGSAPDGAAWQLPARNTWPVVSGLTARSYPGKPAQMVISWAVVPGADRYIVEQSVDGIVWTRSGEVSSNTYSATALYGAATLIRVAAVGLTRGPWVSVAFALGSDFMWLADAQPMWTADANLMWRS